MSVATVDVKKRLATEQPGRAEVVAMEQPPVAWSPVGNSVTTDTTSVRWHAGSEIIEEHRRELLLLVVLSLLLHVFVIQRVQNAPEKALEPKPPEYLELTLVAPPPPPPPPPPAVIEEPPPPIVEELPPPPEPEVVSTEPPPKPKPKKQKPKPRPKQDPPPPVVSAPTPPVPPTPQPAPPPVEEPVVEAQYSAAYLNNPAPDYPEIAQRRGWTGRVLLRVLVTSSGRAASVTVKQSSGRDLLDAAALEAVQRWTFVPAKRGKTPIEGYVTVPITFQLD